MLSIIRVEHNALDPVKRKKIKWLLGLFILGLVMSGITAFPLWHETRWLVSITQDWGSQFPDLVKWVRHVHEGLDASYRQYPFLGYSYDWLAFGHLVIALFFIGPWREPVANLWVIHVGMVACIAVIPLAMVCGAIRGIPSFW